ncbi:conserved hypothetical protein [Thermotomaculum hydrothermale]|uniref:THIF-type NAD/FAD binding fold domain-containing protein n=1 Tax=Thermotomaculum hydrothermale TaxID=981385 RepID=A0A7R6SYZ6_9BACT|nr:ThiF family adenylyltransferase [Thermotomaculum hydrothermale]BBB33106.1 conserved hypothetical protein [Thermotomaculum hydrothermale]
MFLSRLEILYGKEGIEKLKKSKVLVAGLGGVGGICAEALVRSGVGHIGVIDGDCVEESNLNRQILAFHSTIGINKTEVFEKRAKDINPEIKVDKYPYFINKDTFDNVPLESYKVVADCIDSLIPKLNLIIKCLEKDIPVIASTGSGFKINPEMVKSGSIWETKNDPLAYRMRKKLRQWGYGDRDFTVVYSLEKSEVKGEVVGSIMTVTATFGLLIAQKVIEKIIDNKQKKGD